ncbi:MAG: adenylyltransferase/cytidyltransferase family protein [Kiritimatiellae bacterium]|nr:adenylyltransferase/cytidyltransferase family protein [Kiritimatiellia bacterium]
MRVGIYGGSFNPVHLGHVGIARRAIGDLGLDRLVVVPANASPFKAGEAASPLWNRLELVRAAFAGLDRVVVDDREMRRGGVSYTIDTVRELVSENPPGTEFFFITGEDCVADLPKWRSYDELSRLVTFKAYPRTRESSTEIRRLFGDNRVTLNPDARIVATVRAGVVRKNGYCPCRIPKLPEFFCPCDEFKAQLADPEFHGLCHCRLYLKP